VIHENVRLQVTLINKETSKLLITEREEKICMKRGAENPLLFSIPVCMLVIISLEKVSTSKKRVRWC